jgi:hypothetical protein
VSMFFKFVLKIFQAIVQPQMKVAKRVPIDGPVPFLHNRRCCLGTLKGLFS